MKRGYEILLLFFFKLETPASLYLATPHLRAVETSFPWEQKNLVIQKPPVLFSVHKLWSSHGDLMYSDLAFAPPLMQVPHVASCTCCLISSWVYFGLLTVAQGLFIACHDAHIQSISTYSLPQQMVSSFCTFHVAQMLQNHISLGHNL